MSKDRNKALKRYAGLFKALSNPNRLRIFERLLSCCRPGTVTRLEPGDQTYVGDLARDLDIGPSTVSHHLKELRRAGLIKTERRGQRIECYLDPQAIRDLAGFFNLTPGVHALEPVRPAGRRPRKK
ncbi:MAG: transcriptional regulator [Desulfarculus sp.]|nr:MAG: transcriptional regulator [Desulfarculus sp.]